MKDRLISCIVTAAICASIVLIIYLGYIFMFPYAEPFEHLPTDNLFKISISAIDRSSDMDIEEFRPFFSMIGEPKPTRRQSNNDSPYNDTYCCVDITYAQDKTCRYYIYTIQDTTYLEQPYVGVYEIDKNVLEFLKELLP